MKNQLFTRKNNVCTNFTCDELQIMKMVMDQSVMMIIIDDKGHFLYANPYFLNFTNYSSEELDELNYWEMNAYFQSDYIEEEMAKKISQTGKWNGELCNRKKCGELYWVQTSITPVINEKGEHQCYFLLFHEEQNNSVDVKLLRYQALHDELTGLPNRRKLKQDFKEYMADAKENETSFSLLFIDLDHFKKINDQYGHAVGDTILKEVAHRLKIVNLFSNRNQVYRQSGDEFIILLNNIEEINEKANAILSLFYEPFRVGAKLIYVNASVGISIFPDHTDDSEMLFKYADYAMYESKKMVGNTYEMYRTDLNRI